MRRPRLTPAARADIEEIREHIGRDSPEAGRKVVLRLRQQILFLARNPRVGHLREDLTDPPLRFWPVYSFLVVYRERERRVEVIRVLHGARDVQAILTRTLAPD